MIKEQFKLNICYSYLFTDADHDDTLIFIMSSPGKLFKDKDLTATKEHER